MTEIDLGPVDEFIHGRVRIVSIDDKEVGLVAWRGEVFALRNICPHLGAPICTGSLYPLLSQPSVEDVDVTVHHDTPVLMCPWHHWEFDLRSGACTTGRQRVKTYPVHIQDGRVKVDLDATPSRTPA